MQNEKDLNSNTKTDNVLEYIPVELPKVKKPKKLFSREPKDTPTFKNKKNRINLIYDRHFENYEIEVIDLKDDKLDYCESYAEIIRQGFQPTQQENLQYGTQPKIQPLRKMIDNIENTLKDFTEIKIVEQEEPEEVKPDDSTKTTDETQPEKLQK